MTNRCPSLAVRRYVGFDCPKPNCAIISIELDANVEVPHLLQFERGLDLRGVLLDIPLESSLINGLPHYACHDGDLEVQLESHVHEGEKTSQPRETSSDRSGPESRPVVALVTEVKPGLNRGTDIAES